MDITISRKKLVIIGDGNCGKTSLLYAFKNRTFLEGHTPTIVETYVDAVCVDGTQVEFVIWDTAGQEEYERLRPLFYRDSDIIIICYSVDNRESFDNIIDKWFPDLKYFCPKVPTILIGTKIDLREEKLSSREKKYKTRNVRTDEGEEIARRMKAHMFLECSCKTFQGVDEIFHEAARYFLQHKGPRIEKEKCCKCLLL